MNKSGEIYEAMALKYLTKKGLKLLAQNYHSRFGEVDLIMEHHQELVFVEVRYRSNCNYGSPLESVTNAKQNKIIKTAQIFIANKNLWNKNARFDIVSITQQKHLFRKYNIEWLPAAFTCQ